MSTGSTGPLVSVITPLYNSSAFIGATLDSLRAQTYRNWEAILVDDGSTDDTARAVEPYLADSRFKYIRERNQGIAGARNAGIRAAAGEWVCLLDHDDRWLPSKLEKQLRYARAHGCDIVCSDAFSVTSEGRWVYSRGFPEAAEEARRAATDEGVDVFGLLIRVNFMCTCSVMLRRSLFDERGLMDADSAPADDYEMWLRCMPEARVGFVGEPLVEYLVHEGNYSKDEERMFRKVVHVLRKHRRRHAADPGRVRQFDQALLLWHEKLLTKLMGRRAYGEVMRQSVPLLAEGRGGLRALSKTVGAPFVTRLVNSIQYRLGLTRT